MYIEEKDGELVITEKTGCLWLVGLFFAIIGGTFVYGSLGGFSNWNEVETWQIFLTFVMGSLGILVGCWVIFRAPFTKIFINRYTNTIIHRTRGVLSKEEKIYHFDEVKQFFVIEGKDDDGDEIWDLALELQNGETVKLSVISGPIEEDRRNIVFQTNEFMHKQMPSYENNLRLDD